MPGFGTGASEKPLDLNKEMRENCVYFSSLRNFNNLFKHSGFLVTFFQNHHILFWNTLLS